MDRIPEGTDAVSNRLGEVGGSSEYPVTSAPSLCNQSDSQLPLNPVCPVRKTFLPDQNIDHQTFHGALPTDQRPSSRFLSWSVSMGCQKPRCLNAYTSPSWDSCSSGSPSHQVVSLSM